MIQLLVIFPIIYKLVEKNARLGIALSGAANLLFEIGVKIFDMDKYYYRLNIGRYLLLIAFGCYLYLYPEHRVKKYQLISMFLIGLGYIVAVFGFNVQKILSYKITGSYRKYVDMDRTGVISYFSGTDGILSF